MRNITVAYTILAIQIIVIVVSITLMWNALDSLKNMEEIRMGELIAIEGVRWTFFAVIITLLIHFVTDFRGSLSHSTKQISLLKSILSEVYFLTKKGGHIEFFRKSAKPSGYTHHKMKEINIDFYWNNLDNKIDGKSTFPLKHLLLHTNDKIIMLNNYRKDEKTWEKIMGFAIQYVFPDLEHMLNKVKEEINCEFKICLTKEEKGKIDDLVNR